MPFIVFVTAYDRYAVEAFEVAALDYVLKPLKRERLAETVRRVVDEVRDGKPSHEREARFATALDTPELQEQMPPLKRLPVRHRREVKLLELIEVPIVFSRDRLVLARADGKEYLVDYTLQELEHRLPRGSVRARPSRRAREPRRDRILRRRGRRAGAAAQGRHASRGERAARGGGAQEIALTDPTDLAALLEPEVEADLARDRARRGDQLDVPVLCLGVLVVPHLDAERAVPLRVALAHSQPGAAHQA